MKRNLLFFTFLVAHFFCCSQTISGHYGQCKQLVYRTSELDVDLFLFDRGSYMILLTDQSQTDADDFVYTIVLSSGRFTKDSNMIILKDDVEKYTMVFNLENARLIAEQSFGLLKNVALCYLNTIEESHVRERFKDYDYYFSEVECEEYNNEHRQEIPLKFGFYGDKYETSLLYNYRVNDDSTFSITYKKIVISEGTWSRNNNVLILTDKDLLFPSYLLIGEDCLMSKSRARYSKIPYVPQN